MWASSVPHFHGSAEDNNPMAKAERQYIPSVESHIS